MQKLDLHGIITETERRGLSFNQLLTIPERDDWEYSDGKSTTCVAFILSMYKAAGVFAPFTESIQVTEFTVSSASSGPSSLQQRNDLLLELLESVSYCTSTVSITHLGVASCCLFWTRPPLGEDPGRVHAEDLRGQPDAAAGVVQRGGGRAPLLPDPGGVQDGPAGVQHDRALRQHERKLPVGAARLQPPGALLIAAAAVGRGGRRACNRVQV